MDILALGMEDVAMLKPRKLGRRSEGHVYWYVEIS